MSRQYQVFGEPLISLRFGSHVPFNSGLQETAPNIKQLGIPQDQITIALSRLEAEIKFSLIHYDNTVLDYLIKESFCTDPVLLGKGLPLYSDGNHFVGIGIPSTINPNQSWRFPSAYLVSTNYTAGTKRSVVECVLRAVSYTGVLFDRQDLSV